MLSSLTMCTQHCHQLIHLKFTTFRNGLFFHSLLVPTKFETKEEETDEEATATTSAEVPNISGIIEKPIHINVAGKTKMYKCGNWDITPTRSRMGMDSHIHAVHTKKALVCSFCPFSTYNMDSLQKHEKEHQ